MLMVVTAFMAPMEKRISLYRGKIMLVKKRNYLREKSIKRGDDCKKNSLLL